MRRKLKVAFVCVHNACRSQIAEALGKHLASDVFECYSAGTKIRDSIQPDAVRLVKEKYGIDMEKTQFPKLLEDIPQPDILITMGCDVECPTLACAYREDWGLKDPSGMQDAAFQNIIRQIEENVRILRARVLENDACFTKP